MDYCSCVHLVDYRWLWMPKLICLQELVQCIRLCFCCVFQWCLICAIHQVGFLVIFCSLKANNMKFICLDDCMLLDFVKNSSQNLPRVSGIDVVQFILSVLCNKNTKRNAILAPHKGIVRPFGVLI